MQTPRGHHLDVRPKVSSVGAVAEALGALSQAVEADDVQRREDDRSRQGGGGGGGRGNIAADGDGDGRDGRGGMRGEGGGERSFVDMIRVHP